MHMYMYEPSNLPLELATCLLVAQCLKQQILPEGTEDYVFVSHL